MALEIVEFRPEHLPAVARFSEQTWQRPRTQAFVEWRYLDVRSGQRNVIALHNGECVAMVGASERQWNVNGTVRPFLETMDWFVRPDARLPGVGVRVMQKMMHLGPPVLAVNATEQALSLMTKLGWASLNTIPTFTLPLHEAAVVEPVIQRFGLSRSIAQTAAGPAVLAWRALHRRRRAPRGGSVTVLPAPYADLDHVSRRTGNAGARQLPSPDRSAWLLAGTPSMGEYVTLQFNVGSDVAGWSFSRVYRSPEHGRLEAKLLDLAPVDAPALVLDWMVGETASRLSRMAADSIWTSTPVAPLQAALKRAGFISGQPREARFWPAGGPALPSDLRFVANTCDEAILPYPRE